VDISPARKVRIADIPMRWCSRRLPLAFFASLWHIDGVSGRRLPHPQAEAQVAQASIENIDRAAECAASNRSASDITRERPVNRSRPQANEFAASLNRHASHLELLIWCPSAATAALIAEDIRHRLGVTGRAGGWYRIEPAATIEMVRRACSLFPSPGIRIGAGKLLQ
jgi:hypothetical protein